LSHITLGRENRFGRQGFQWRDQEKSAPSLFYWPACGFADNPHPGQHFVMRGPDGDGKLLLDRTMHQTLAAGVYYGKPIVADFLAAGGREILFNATVYATGLLKLSGEPVWKHGRGAPALGAGADEQVPSGTTERSAVPDGTCIARHAGNPALKRWAIVKASLTGRRLLAPSVPGGMLSSRRLFVGR
jgi:hypothetical protein